MFTWDELEQATGGVWVHVPDGGNGVSGVSTDSRIRQDGGLFVALRGENFDGHEFCAKAVAEGATAVCVDRGGGWGVPALQVADTLVAYQALAAFHRQRCGVRTVGITGSSGKTSTKEMMAAVLRTAGPVLATEGNTNNHVGVPQNVLRLQGDEAFAVLEMGTSGPGEIEPLSRVAAPAVAIITNIGPVHLERLGSVAGVAKEKATIAAGLEENGALVVPYAEAKNPAILAQGRRLVTFGTEAGADIRVQAYEEGPPARFELVADGECATVAWNLAGPHQACNAAAVIAAALSLGLDLQESAAALAEVQIPGMRMQETVVAGVRWLNDAYNANPDSMTALLRTVRAPSGGRLVLVLGDMLELGPEEVSYHEQVLKLAKELPDAVLVPVGSRMCEAAQSLGINGFADIAAARKGLAQVRDGDLVVLKASRGMRLEGLVPASEEPTEPIEKEEPPEETGQAATQTIGEMPFMEHLRELRLRVLRSVASVAVLFVIAILGYQYYVKYFTDPFFYLALGKVVMTSPEQGFMLQFRIAGYVALVFSSPIHIYNIISIVSPALEKREQRILRVYTWAGLTLAILGAWLAYFQVLPLAVEFLLKFKPESVENFLDYKRSVLFVFQLILAFVVLFQAPLVLLILMTFNLIKRSWLLSSARYVIVGIFLLSALVTPPDIVSQVMLAIPLVVMFYAAILIAKIMGVGED